MCLANLGNSSSVAEASCGDYVWLGSHAGPLGPHPSDSHAQLHGTATSIDGRDRGQFPGQAPCHGPHCRRQNAPPGLPVPVVTPTSQQQFACLNVPRTETAVRSDRTTIAQRLPGSEVFPGRIDRPPRQSS